MAAVAQGGNGFSDIEVEISIQTSSRLQSRRLCRSSLTKGGLTSAAVWPMFGNGLPSVVDKMVVPATRSDPVTQANVGEYWLPEMVQSVVSCTVEFLVDVWSKTDETLNDVVCHHLIGKHFRPVVLPVYIGALKIVGSCNGLVCLLGNSELIVVWNPSTRHARLLTVPNEFRFGSIRFYGFGYDSTIDDYKVLVGHTSIKNGTRTTTVVILQLKTESWRTIDCVDYVHLLGQGCLVNGALHWVEMAWKEVLMIQPVLHARIMSFDLAGETFREFIPLSYLSRDERLISARVGIAEDSLFVYLFTDSGIKMWVMKEYRVNGTWTKETQIPTTAPHLPQKFCYCNPICILENGEVLINSGDLMLYNPNGGGNRNVLGTPADLAPEPVMYVESLVSPLKEDN
ncbi:hypothetical protein ACLB2K_073890 [Fragaria x ananassa]